jgi:hypothetical protein
MLAVATKAWIIGDACGLTELPLPDMQEIPPNNVAKISTIIVCDMLTSIMHRNSEDL